MAYLNRFSDAQTIRIEGLNPFHLSVRSIVNAGSAILESVILGNRHDAVFKNLSSQIS